MNQNTHDYEYISALISIEALTAGSATARLNSMRMIDMPKMFSDVKSRVDILHATTQANALNQQTAKKHVTQTSFLLVFGHFWSLYISKRFSGEAKIINFSRGLFSSF